MKQKFIFPLIAVLFVFLSTANAQLRKSGNDNVYTKTKKNIVSTRRTDLAAYKNSLFIMDNAFKSNDMDKALESYNNIKALAKVELDRVNNNLIDLYAIPNKSENINQRISKLEKRIKKMQQRYQIFTKTDLTIDANSKESRYAYNTIKQFAGFMEQNFEEFDNGGDVKAENATKTADVKLDLKKEENGGMINSKSAETNKARRNTEIKNPEIKKYIDEQRLNVSAISKKSRELIKSLSEKDYAVANTIKQSIASKMQSTINADKQMSKRVENEEFKDLKLNNTSLKRTIESEMDLLKEFNKLQIPKDNSRLMSIINDFNRLNRYL